MSDKKTCGCGHKHDGLECAGTQAAHENIVRQIDNGHWAVMGIFSDEDDPFHTFSVGLYENFDQPEIVIFGVHPQMAGRIINDIGERIARGFKLEAGRVYDDVLTATTAPFSFRLKSINMMPIWDRPCGITRATTFLSCNWYGRTPMESSPGKMGLIPTTPVRSRSLVSYQRTPRSCMDGWSRPKARNHRLLRAGMRNTPVPPGLRYPGR